MPDYWAVAPEAALAALGTSGAGLSEAEAGRRLAEYGVNAMEVARPPSRLRVIGRQLMSPLVFLLIFAASVSALTAAWVDAGIVLTIIAASAGLGYMREYRAETTAFRLSSRVRTRAAVVRGGMAREVDATTLVPGDIVLLRAGVVVPADGLLIEATDLHVSEAVLTGESFPVHKDVGKAEARAPLRERRGAVMLGTNVRSGTARFVVAATGSGTEFGAVAHKLALRPPETEFERGVRRFGMMLTTGMSLMVLVVFGLHILSGRPAVETLLFSIALAVGLSPELLPAILGVNLARGAGMMARRGVLVRHLPAIENLGSMDVLCTDKTGTLTEGTVTVDGGWDVDGRPAATVIGLARVNAGLGTGLANPLDEALLAGGGFVISEEKLAEVPFDFVRKRVSVVVATAEGARFIVKGAVPQVVAACVAMRSGAVVPMDARAREKIDALVAGWAERGVRALAVATRDGARMAKYAREDEEGLVLEGFVTFVDQPKAGAAAAIAELKALGVSVKMITGDSAKVARHLAGLVGLPITRVLTGAEIDAMKDEAFWRAAEMTDIFAEVDPNEKERIILALKKTGHVVGFLGDGVNDAPAMHAADTSISVESAVDVAREAADFVLLEHDLGVIRAGILEGRRTFANTLKYVQTTLSANLGNMLSMALASAFLPFLPLTAGQILLNNLLSDIPAFGLATDAVDDELVAKPRRWDMRQLGRFMVRFGALSSVFDLLTFGTLLICFEADAALFRTGWFVESLLTELVVALSVRTARPLIRSRPGRVLVWATVVVAVIALMVSYLPMAGALGFVPLPLEAVAAIVLITCAYLLAVEVLKRHEGRRG